MDQEQQRLINVIMALVDSMEPLPGMISDLLRREPHGGRRTTASVDRTLRSWKFIELELRSLIASLTKLQELLPDLRPDFINPYRSIDGWSTLFFQLVNKVHDQLTGADQPSLGGCQARLHGAATRFFCRDARRLLSDSTGDDMQEILTSLHKAAESPWRYTHLMLPGDGERTSSSAAQLPHPYADDGGASLVGIEGALTSKHLKWFMAADREADSKALKVMAMVGPAGVGKTTLSMEVYRQLQQTGDFQGCATAKVSRNPDFKQLLNHILSQIDRPEASHSTSQPQFIAYKIKQCLQGKRYLVAIHDLWRKSDWDIIKNAFPENNLGSRIMITTQLRSTGHLCCSHCDHGLVYDVKPLGALDSKRLLFKQAFGSEDACPTENLKQACEEILRRCEGIPLFIIGMANWMHEQVQKAQPSKKSSDAKNKREVHNISTNYSMDTVPKLLKQFELVLATIYDDLPYDLKAVLVYMSVFPEGYIFDKDTLIEKWVNQGMIGEDLLDDSVEIAQYYLCGLIDRNVFTPVAASSRNHLQLEEAGCQWHVGYFMLQFLASKSAQFLACKSAHDHGFVCTSRTLELHSVQAAGGKTALRRLSLHQPHQDLPTQLEEMDLSQTRLLCVSGEVSQVSLKRFGNLVVLDLEGWQHFNEKEDMLLICKMYLLRYLSLRNVKGLSKLPPEIKELQFLVCLDISQTSICELPSQLGELHWLKKLDIRSTKVRQLPKKLFEYRRLQCLLVGGDGATRDETVTEIPEEVRWLGRLSTLATVDLTRGSPELVDAVGSVQETLAVKWSFRQCTDRRFQKATHGWDCFTSLTIYCGLGCCMDFLDFPPDEYDQFKKFKMVDGRFTGLPKWFSGLRFLTYIEITVCTLLPADVSVLGDLSLECLVLGLHFIPEAAVVIEGERLFSCLRRFSVSCRVPWLTFRQGVMPALTFLELKIAGSPASQESIPSGISNLRRLSDVFIQYHENYVNSTSVKMTVEAVKNGIAEHPMPINLFINGIEDQEEDAQEAGVAQVLVTASASQCEIQTEENSTRDQEENTQKAEEGAVSEIESAE